MEPIDLLRKQLISRGNHGIKSFARLFRIMDDNGSKNIDFEEFKKGVADQQLVLSSQQVEDLFKYFDRDNSGSISFDEVLISLRPPMNSSRKSLIKKAFNKLDSNGDGIVTIHDIRGKYSVKQNPKYLNGLWTADQCFLEFLKQFDSPNDPDGKVTYEEFENYYSSVSSSIDEDSYFDLMMRNSWRL